MCLKFPKTVLVSILVGLKGQILAMWEGKTQEVNRILDKAY